MSDKIIRIDEQVYTELQGSAKPFEDTPNMVLRRILGLDPTQEEHPVKEADPQVYLIPCSPKEFKTIDMLVDYINELAHGDGIYAVASTHFWRNVPSDSILLFHKSKLIVGEGQLEDRLQPYTGTEVSPVTGKRYEGQLVFDTDSIKVYSHSVTFADAETILGKTLTYRGKQQLNWEDYKKLQTLVIP